MSRPDTQRTRAQDRRRKLLAYMQEEGCAHSSRYWAQFSRVYDLRSPTKVERCRDDLLALEKANQIERVKGVQLALWRAHL